jgi:hypothetical protein
MTNKKFTYYINTAIGMPVLKAEQYFVTDEAAINYGQTLAANFAGVPWFLTVEIVEGEARHLGTLRLPAPKAEFKPAE